MRFTSILVPAIVLSSLVAGGPLLADAPSGSGGQKVHTPVPTAKPTPTPKPAPIPVPVGLQNARNPQVCSAHSGLLGVFACGAAYTGGALVIVFNWTGDRAYPTASGFDVYEVDNGLHKLVDQNTTQATLGIVTRPRHGFGNRCYAITAVVGKAQSEPSRWLCLASNSVGPFTTVITPNATAVRTQSHQNRPGLSGTIGPGFNCANATPCVGGLYIYQTCCPTSISQTLVQEIATYWRSYFHFRLNPDLKNKYLIKATLSDGTTKASAPTSNKAYCLDEMGTASSDWMSGAGGPSNIVGGDFKRVDSSSLASGIDVTSTVRSWLNGSTPNNGFVLRGKLETLNYVGSPDISCVWQLDKDAKLSVVHS